MLRLLILEGGVAHVAGAVGIQSFYLSSGRSIVFSPWPSGAVPGYSSEAEAVEAGADYIVVGRPILKANNPGDAAKRILDEMKG